MPLYEFSGVRPTLGRNVYIAPNATVIGDVHLGDDASVWFGAVLRGDVCPIRIGARTNIQDGAVVHVTQGIASVTIGDDVTVGHLALLHGCNVGHRVLVGMGSVLLDNCVIGDDCIIGAGSLIPPGKVIPPRSLVMGRPGKIVRDVTSEDLVRNEASAAAYVEYAKAFEASLRPIER